MAAACNTPDVSEKIIKFESFVNEKLKTDLANVLKRDEETACDIENCIQISILLTQFRDRKFTSDPCEPVKTMTDIGGNFYVETVIDDPDSVMVYLGLGFYVQMSLNDALSFLDQRKSMLQKRRENYALIASKINANIKLVLEGLRELQSISPTNS